MEIETLQELLWTEVQRNGNAWVLGPGSHVPADVSPQRGTCLLHLPRFRTKFLQERPGACGGAPEAPVQAAPPS